METALQKKIKNYLETNKVSVTELERQAGLKSNVARNILRGISKKPTAVTLQAISGVLGCTVEDLLGIKTDSPKLGGLSSHEGSLVVKNPDLLERAFNSLLKIVKVHGYQLTLQQIFFVLGEVYTYSLEKSPPRVDEDFIEWLIKRTID